MSANINDGVAEALYGVAEALDLLIDDVLLDLRENPDLGGLSYLVERQEFVSGMILSSATIIVLFTPHTHDELQHVH